MASFTDSVATSHNHVATALVSAMGLATSQRQPSTVSGTRITCGD
jgi:hypothetical protein